MEMSELAIYVCFFSSNLTQIQRPDLSRGLMKTTRMSLSKRSHSLNMADVINNP